MSYRSESAEAPGTTPGQHQAGGKRARHCPEHPDLASEVICSSCDQHLPHRQGSEVKESLDWCVTEEEMCNTGEQGGWVSVLS